MGEPSNETSAVNRTFDMRAIIGVGLSLLLLAVAVAPLCVMMTPAEAMASEISVSSGCNQPGGMPSASCPRTSSHVTLQTKQETPDIAVVSAAVAIGPVPVTWIAQAPLAAPDNRPVARLTPLRL